MGNVIETAAIETMARGWATFPVTGKTPVTTHGVLDASTEERLASIWFERHPDRGLAIATGIPSGVWVLDFDSDEAIERFTELQAKHGDVKRGVVSRTARGYHLFFKMPEHGDIRNSAGKLALGIDVRGTGGYVVVPPSPHPSGETYRWAKGRGPDDIAMVAAPAWLIEKAQAGKMGDGPADPLPDRIVEGGRNDLLTSLAGSLRRRGGSDAAMLAAITAENEARCVPPLLDDELRGIAASVVRYAPAPITLLNPNEVPINGVPVMEVTDSDVLNRLREDKLLPLSVVSTPWPIWNRVCRGAGGGRGLAHGWHILIASSSGAGKSLAAINLAAAAVRAGEHVCLISLEMSQAEVVTRLLAIYSGSGAMSLEHGPRFSTGAWDSAAAVLQEADGSIRVNPDPVSDLRQIAAIIDRYQDEGCRTFIIDYLQLAWVRNAETMANQITEVSHTIRGLAQKYKILTIGLSQFNRQASYAGELVKEGLMGGSSLENDADQVLLIGKQKTEAPGLYRAEVKLDKNRHGPPIEWSMILDTETLRMREAMPDEEPVR